MKKLLILTILLGGFLAPSFASAGAETLNLKGILILANNSGEASDARVKPYESKLKRLFKFNHYAYYGEGRGKVALPGGTTLNLGKGYALSAAAESSEGGKHRLKVDWKKGSKSLIKTTLVVKRGVPTVLGGPRHGDGNLIVVIVAE